MHDMKNLAKLKDLKELSAESMDAFMAFDKAALADGEIPKKYKELIALGVALTTQCSYCLEIHKKAAIEAGANKKEIAETIFVATVLNAGAALTHGTHLI